MARRGWQRGGVLLALVLTTLSFGSAAVEAAELKFGGYAKLDLIFRRYQQNQDLADPGSVRIGRGRLFIVGDPKQSIYRFRRADVQMYEAVKTALLKDGARLLPLRTNFRSDPRILDTENAAIAPVMQGGAHPT